VFSCTDTDTSFVPLLMLGVACSHETSEDAIHAALLVNVTDVESCVASADQDDCDSVKIGATPSWKTAAFSVATGVPDVDVKVTYAVRRGTS